MDFTSRLLGQIGLIRDWTIPDWIIVIAAIAAAIALALLAHRIAYSLLARFLGDSGFTTALLVANRTRGPSRLALLMLALAIIVPVTPIDPELRALIARLMRISFIALLGWMAIVAVDIVTRVYLRRFDVSAEDNLVARKHTTQVGILKRAIEVLVIVITVAAALMTIDQVRELGISLFASAGVAGLAVGLAARPLLASLIAGIQIAVTQPIRIDDVVIVEGEYGTVEEITSTYVVVKLWDWRRMVLPLSYFIEKPFQNWTRETSSIIGAVTIEADYSTPVEAVRRRLDEIARASKLWDGKVVNLQVVEAKESTIQLRALVSARTAPIAWDLRCEVREKLIAFLRREHPDALPRRRIVAAGDWAIETSPAGIAARKQTERSGAAGA